MNRQRPPRAEPTELRQILQLFRDEAGLSFSPETEFVVERKLRERILALDLISLAEYLNLLRSGPEGRREMEIVLDEVTTHETYFFREEFQLRLFRNELLPRLRALAEPRRRLTLWSAGCSTGEEAYTLAMILDEARDFDDWVVRVVGTDLSRRCVMAARRGIYGGASFRAVPREYMARHFSIDEGGARVNDELKSRCLFLQANLLDGERHPMIGRVEAIFCRNVLIYLCEDARKRVLQVLYDRLCPGGYLLLGHSESLLHGGSSFEVVNLQGDVVYRRPERDDGYKRGG